MDTTIGVIGGSGFYAFLEDAREIAMETPYGFPSAPIAVGRIEGTPVAFLPRHGKEHQFPPHVVNYRANIWALKELSVRRIIGPCAAGSLRLEMEPGQFVISDQLVDRTWGRHDTFYDGPRTTHVAFDEPYCPELRALALATAREAGIIAHDGGTVVTIQGPRFSTKAESRWFQSQGWEVLNMTQYPEAYLARELEMCYVNIALITDYDFGLETGAGTVSHEAVVRVFQDNLARLRELLMAIVSRIPEARDCICSRALAGAT